MVGSHATPCFQRTYTTALASFLGDAGTTPGRFNVMPYRGATLILDYGHNPDAIRALTEAIAVMSATRRTVVVSGAGDRRDCDLRHQTEILGSFFDEVILYEDQCQRGRADGEVLSLLKEGLANATRARRVHQVYGELSAIDMALDALAEGELCLVLIDQVDESISHIQKRAQDAELLQHCA